MLSIIDPLNRGAEPALTAVVHAGGADPSIPLLLGAILAGGFSVVFLPARPGTTARWKRSSAQR